MYGVDNFLELGLCQINNCFNTLKTLLDLLFISSNINWKIYESQYPLSPISMHHVPLCIDISFYKFATVNANADIFNFKKSNFHLLNNALMKLIGKMSFLI